VVSHIAAEPWVDGPDDAVRRLMAVGLGSTASDMLRPYSCLSSGERARADVARALRHGAVIDDFASAVDRGTARAMSAGLARYVRERQLEGVVVAACHEDVKEWLQPDWILDAGSGAIVIDPAWPEPARPRAVWACSQPADKGLSTEGLMRTSDLAQRQKQALLPRGSMPSPFTSAAPAASGSDSDCGPWDAARPGLTLDIVRVHYEVYEDVFPGLHYKEGINSSARCYAATDRGRGGIPVAFLALLPQTGARGNGMQRPARAGCSQAGLSWGLECWALWVEWH
jgi:hypothetical protein